jgi:hypothetical protein
MGFLLAKRQLLIETYDKSGCRQLLQYAPAWGGLLVFNYHRIGNPAQSPFDWDLWSADEAAFDWQIQFLKQNFDIVGPADLADVM